MRLSSESAYQKVLLRNYILSATLEETSVYLILMLDGDCRLYSLLKWGRLSEGSSRKRWRPAIFGETFKYLETNNSKKFPGMALESLMKNSTPQMVLFTNQ